MQNNVGTKAKVNKNGSVNRSGWVIGGTTMIGVGVGFILLPISALFFVAAILMGIGSGLLITSLVPGGRS